MPSAAAAAATITFARLTDASPAAILPAVVAIDSGFTEDVITRALNHGEPDDPGTPEGMAYWTPHVRVSVLDMEAYTASVDGEVVAVLLAKPPGVVLGETPNAPGPVNGNTSGMKQDMMDALEDIDKHLKNFSIDAFGAQAFDDSWNITNLATSRQHQRKGYGGALLEAFLEMVKSRGNQPVTLVTMTLEHVKFYARFGFKVVAESNHPVMGTPLDWWAMSTNP